jgi:hypothetical protein
MDGQWIYVSLDGHYWQKFQQGNELYEFYNNRESPDHLADLPF